METINQKIEITELNIEEMSVLAESVLNALHINYTDYDEEGNEIFAKYYDIYKDYDEISPLVREEKIKLYNCPDCSLLGNLFRRGDRIGDVRYYTLEDVKPWIEPLIPRVLGIFRKGVGTIGDCNYVAATSVPDEYLITLFAREVRNRMMIFAGQRRQAEVASKYLLLLEADSGHDRDEWIGIYFDNKDLKKAYDELTNKLERYKEKDKSYCSMKVAIWEFRPELEDEEDRIEKEYIVPMQIVSLVDPKTLNCFQGD